VRIDVDDVSSKLPCAGQMIRPNRCAYGLTSLQADEEQQADADRWDCQLFADQISQELLFRCILEPLVRQLHARCSLTVADIYIYLRHVISVG
jgi:hypothetical protein